MFRVRLGSLGRWLRTKPGTMYITFSEEPSRDLESFVWVKEIRGEDHNTIDGWYDEIISKYGR